MMSYDSKFEEEYLQCELCFTTFDPENKIPQSLPCSHVYCEGCMTRWFEQGKTTCPKCKKDYKEALTNLPTSYGILNLVNYHKENQYVFELCDRTKCQEHQNAHMLTCLTCTKHLCEKCIDDHPRHQLTAFTSGKDKILEKYYHQRYVVMTKRDELNSYQNRGDEDLGKDCVAAAKNLEKLVETVKDYGMEKVNDMKIKARDPAKIRKETASTLQELVDQANSILQKFEGEIPLPSNETWLMKCQELQLTYQNVHEFEGNLKGTFCDVTSPEQEQHLRDQVATFFKVPIDDGIPSEALPEPIKRKPLQGPQESFYEIVKEEDVRMPKAAAASPILEKREEEPEEPLEDHVSLINTKSHIRAMETSLTGDIFVADGHMVTKYTAGGKLTWSKPLPVSNLTLGGSLLALHNDMSMLYKLNPTTGEYPVATHCKYIEIEEWEKSAEKTLHRLSIDKNGNVYILTCYSNKVILWRASEGNPAHESTGTIQFNRYTSVFTGGVQNFCLSENPLRLFLVENQANAIICERLDLKKQDWRYGFNKKKPNEIPADQRLSSPSAIALSKKGILYIADTKNNRIVQLSLDGVFLGSIQQPNMVIKTVSGMCVYEVDGQDVIVVQDESSLIKRISVPLVGN